MVKQRNIIVLIVIVLLALLLVNGGILPFTSSGLNSLDKTMDSCSSSDFKTFSIDTVSIQGKGDRILITGALSGSDCLTIKLTPNILNKYLEDKGLKATETITGSLKLQEYTRTYFIQRTGKEFYTVGLNYIQEGTSLQTNPYNYCRNNIDNAIYGYRTYPFTDVRCVAKESDGIEGSFDNARYSDDFKVEVIIGNDDGIVKRGDTSISLNGGKSIVSWRGNLASLDGLDSPQYDSRLISSQWELVEDGARVDLENEISNFISNMDRDITSVINLDKSYDKHIVTFKNKKLQILENKLSQYRLDNSPIIEDATTDNNALYVSMQRGSAPIGLFVLELDAEWAGIIPTEGKPSITKCIDKDLDLESGKNEILEFDVLNEGLADAKFEGEVTCNSGIKIEVPQFRIGKEEEKIIKVTAVPSNKNKGDLLFNCKLTIRDIESDNEDSCNFDGSVKYVSGTICTAGGLYCDDNSKNILKCGNDGETKTTYKECAYGCTYSSGVAKCRSKDESELGFFGKIWDPIKNFFNTLFSGTLDLFNIIKYVIVALSSLLSLFASAGELEKIKTLERNGLAKWILAIVIGLSVGTILYMFIYGLTFWIIVALVIAYLIFKSKITKLLMAIGV